MFGTTVSTESLQIIKARKDLKATENLTVI